VALARLSFYFNLFKPQLTPVWRGQLRRPEFCDWSSSEPRHLCLVSLIHLSKARPPRVGKKRKKPEASLALSVSSDAAPSGSLCLPDAAPSREATGRAGASISASPLRFLSLLLSLSPSSRGRCDGGGSTGAVRMRALRPPWWSPSPPTARW